MGSTGNNIFCVATFIFGLCLGSYGERLKTARLEAAWAKEQAVLAVNLVKATEALREKEQKIADSIGLAGKTYLEKKDEAKAKGDMVVADLVRGHTRLRNELSGCEATRAVATAEGRRQLDEAARIRAEIAGAVVQAGAECDAQVGGLQSVLTLEREIVNGRN
ncbi:MAG: hypothetical protein FWG52_09795 [Proteobacteria bacterium]|nr:hypothetical protein [Pseudomonadota bacterium]